MTQNDPSSPKFTLFFQFFRRAHFCIKTGKRGALFFSKNRGLDGRKDGQSSNFGCLLLQSATPLRVQNFIKLRKMAQIAISQKRHSRPQFQNSENTFQYKLPPKTYEKSPQKPLSATRKWFFGHRYVQNVRFLRNSQTGMRENQNRAKRGFYVKILFVRKMAEKPLLSGRKWFLR